MVRGTKCFAAGTPEQLPRNVEKSGAVFVGHYGIVFSDRVKRMSGHSLHIWFLSIRNTKVIEECKSRSVLGVQSEAARKFG